MTRLTMSVLQSPAGRTRQTPVVADPPFDRERRSGERPRGFQVPYASEIKKEAEIKTMAVGRIIDAEQAEAILRDRDADLIGIGRELMYNPFWGLHAAETLKNETALEGWPDQYRWAITRRADLEKNDR